MDVHEMVVRVEGRGRGSFQSVLVRDAVVRGLKLRGVRVRRGSLRNQQLSPEYVLDYEGSFGTGFGNADYKTFFPVIYTIEVVY